MLQVGATAWRRKSGGISGQAGTMRMVRLLEHALFPECASAVPYLPRVDIDEPVDSEPDADVEYEELLPRHGTY